MLKKIQSWIDKVTLFIACILIAIMFIVLIANVILRAIPAMGGFRWYMEFSQYANVWAMLIGAVGIAVTGSNLRVEAVDSIMGKIKGGDKIAKIIVDISLIVFYAIMTVSGQQLAKRAVQAVSTMPSFKMGQVYIIFPIAGVLCVIAAIVHLLVTITEKPEDKEALEE